jgi:hypothetical protein
VDAEAADLLGQAAFWSTPFGTALAWKLAAVTAMVIVSAMHDFVQGPAASCMKAGSDQATNARRRAAWLARIKAGRQTLFEDVSRLGTGTGPAVPRGHDLSRWPARVSALPS